jgi:hypothetical protein
LLARSQHDRKLAGGGSLNFYLDKQPSMFDYDLSASGDIRIKKQSGWPK